MLGKEIDSTQIGGVPYRQGIFSTWNDPAKFGLFYHAAIMTRRGDVSAAKNTLKIEHPSKAQWNTAPIKENFEKSAVAAEYKFGGELPEQNPVSQDVITSDTDELLIDRKNNYGLIDTPNTKCAYGFLCKNGEITMTDTKIKCNNDFAVIAMSSLTDDAINKSDNILLTTVGRAENTDAKFAGELMLDIGKPPVLVEVIEADMEIKTDVEGLVVWAISPEGFYIGKVPTTYEDGTLKFTVGKTSQSMYYLIVKE